MFLLRSSVCLLLAVALLPPAAAAEGQLLRKQRFVGSAHVGDTQLAGATFEFACHPARDGSLSLSVVLVKSASAAGFPLDRFEGPDGIGEQQDLAEWSIDTRGDGLRVTSPISGWYGVDGDGFILSRSQANARPDALRSLLRAAIAPEAQRLRLALRPPDGGAALQAELPLPGKQAAIREAVAACIP